MTRYLISFDDGAMVSLNRSCQQLARRRMLWSELLRTRGYGSLAAGVISQRASIVATDGTVTDGPYPETKAVIGGFVIIDVSSREAALEWAAKLAAACRCAQEVREIMFDPLV